MTYVLSRLKFPLRLRGLSGKIAGEDAYATRVQQLRLYLSVCSQFKRLTTGEPFCVVNSFSFSEGLPSEDRPTRQSLHPFLPLLRPASVGVH